MKPTFRNSTEVIKGWGKEVIIVNNESYCGKLLIFKKGKKFSSHFHYDKQESFNLFSGMVIMRYFDLTNGKKLERILNVGDVVDIPRGCPHQIEALEDSTIIEISTPHKDSDSYRIGPGDSQNEN